MADVTTARNWMVPIIALFLATFAVGTSELIVAGVLPALAADFSVDIPTAGLLITGYALGVAVAAPILSLITTGLSRRFLLMGVMAVFVAATALCAVSDSFWMMLAARLLVASCHGLFFGVAMVIATRLAPSNRQNSAVSLIVAGVTLSAVLGIPLGTAIGNAYGWRTTFWLIAVAGVVAGVALFVLIPRLREAERRADSFAAELRAASRPAVLLCYGIIGLFTTGVFSFFAYLVPILTTAGGMPIGQVPWVLFGMGLAGFFGNLIGGRLGDWKSTPTMIGILALFIVLVLAMAMVVTQTWPLIAMLCLAWLVGFGFPAPVQARILKEAQEAPNFASTLISSAFNIGIAAGAAIGGAAIATGWGYGALPLMGVAFLVLALVGTLALAVLDRRTAAIAQPA
ncbi:MFS transporter [Devosia sp. RR2S18]|uniref:MFS transporter n=1 Tax=Devosia rhizosphaerae TaxID=3049774 RepID=UPI0025417B87|nr:MFS transporter [Devosia sp. RR2S18]WIJ26596.1 MFS transporter [Devosia sp. RR2S18]